MRGQGGQSFSPEQMEGWICCFLRLEGMNMKENDVGTEGDSGILPWPC